MLHFLLTVLVIILIVHALNIESFHSVNVPLIVLIIILIACTPNMDYFRSIDAPTTKKPYLKYELSGGFVGHALELNIYNSGDYELFDKGKPKNKGKLSHSQMKHINNTVNIINNIKETEKHDAGADVLNETLTTRNNAVSMNMYKMHAKNNEGFKLLQNFIRSK